MNCWQTDAETASDECVIAASCDRAAARRLRRAVAVPQTPAPPPPEQPSRNSTGRNAARRQPPSTGRRATAAACTGGARADAWRCVARTGRSGANADGVEELRCRRFVDRARAAHRARQSAAVDRARQGPPGRGQLRAGGEHGAQGSVDGGECAARAVVGVAPHRGVAIARAARTSRRRKRRRARSSLSRRIGVSARA